MNIAITLTDDEALGLRTVAADPQEWAENVVRERARQAIEAIVTAEVHHLIAAGEPIPATRSEILASAVAGGRAGEVTEQVLIDPAEAERSK